MLKVKTFVKEGLRLDTGILFTEDDPVEVAKLKEEVQVLIGQSEYLTLNKKSLQVSDTSAGYIAHKAGHLFDGCCKNQFTDDQPNTEYIGILSRGGLKILSLPMSSVVSQAFAILDSTSETIRNSEFPARKAGMVEDSTTLFGLFVHRLSQQTEDLAARLMKVVCNCFLITKGNDLMN